MSIPGGAPSLFLTAAAGAAAGYAIDRSLRFNSADSAHLTRTPSSAGNQKTWSWSAWVKRSKLGGYQSLFADQINNGAEGAAIYFNTGDDRLVFEQYSSGGIQWKLRTEQRFRDCSAWYHLVVVFNTPASTADERMRIYVNGSEVIDFADRTNPSQNFDGSLNRARITDIASYGAFDTSYFNGYLADIQFVDGQALAPTDFGETDSNGVWQATAYSGSYGTNGFHLKFADNSSDAALGTDSSGNSNTWTVNNLQASTGDTTPSENFTAVTYSGTSSTQSISSLAFQPDFIWFKARSYAGSHALVDSVRGISKQLSSNLANAESTNSAGAGPQSFDSNGFTLGNESSATGSTNGSQTYVAWCWNAGANSNKTYTVKVVSDGGNKYRFDDFGTSAVTLKLAEGSTYVFDQSDSSNSGHPLRFSTTSNGTHGGGSEYTTGVTTTGTPGSAGAKTTIVVAASAPTLYYYCTQHSGMGGQANTNSTAGSSNFDGSIQAVVKANQTKGFSIVSWTGNGTTGATVGHGLSSAPKWILVKNRDNSAGVWYTYHASVGYTQYLRLNTTDAASTYAVFTSAPTSTVFAGGNDSIMINGNDFIAYCWSEVTGFSKFGSYTGNGSTTGPTITTGFKPKFLLIKASSIAGEDWVLMDTTRDTGSPVDQILFANGSDAEYTNSAYNTEFQATGFQIKNNNPRFNQNGATYVYMAFADNLGGEGCDSLVDTPEQRAGQTDSGAGGEVVGNYATWNPLSNSTNAPTNGNLDLPQTGGGATRCNGTIAVSSGKWYFETTLVTAGTYTTVGIAASEITDNYPGQDALSYAYTFEQGTKINSNSQPSYGSALGAGDVFQVAMDLDNNKLYFGKNGTWMSSSNPETGANPVYTLSAGTYRPIARPYGGSTIAANFGQRPFAHTAPSGFKSLNTANLDPATIADGSKYFDTKLWTGDGNDNRDITGYNFSPDFVWIKERGSGGDHHLFDIVRGAGKAIRSNEPDAEVTTTNELKAFNSGGFRLGTGGDVNASGTATVGWAWDAGSSTVTNNNGSIASQVRAQPSAGFSIVSYTGTGSAATVGHGLNAAPEFMLVKNRSAADIMVAYHVSVGNTGALRLSTAAVDTGYNWWNSTTPSNSVFTIGTTGATNNSANNYIAYCFAPVAGYSAFGSYTGNSGQNFVHTNFQPRWIMIKTTSITAYPAYTGWAIFDTAREPNNVNLNALFANKSQQEGLRGNGNTASAPDFGIDILSNGFCLRDNGASEINLNGEDYIYAAFAENPFSLARAR